MESNGPASHRDVPEAAHAGFFYGLRVATDDRCGGPERAE
jgi:hypothetical protein